LTFAGDVHGCYDELVALLDKVKYDRGTDNLVLVGDLVNKVRESGRKPYTADGFNRQQVGITQSSTQGRWH
jgi:hypothetical protein